MHVTEGIVDTASASLGTSLVDGVADADDTEPGLYDALRQSEVEALHEEQRHLQDALSRSKADGLAETGQETATVQEFEGADSIVLSHFGRRPRELNEVLLGSSLAARLLALPAHQDFVGIDAHSICSDRISGLVPRGGEQAEGEQKADQASSRVSHRARVASHRPEA